MQGTTWYRICFVCTLHLAKQVVSYHASAHEKGWSEQLQPRMLLFRTQYSCQCTICSGPRQGYTLSISTHVSGKMMCQRHLLTYKPASAFRSLTLQLYLGVHGLNVTNAAATTGSRNQTCCMHSTRHKCNTRQCVQDSVAFAIRASKSTDHENAHLRHLLASQSRYMVTDTDSKGESVRIRYCVLGERKPDSAQYVAFLSSCVVSYVSGLQYTSSACGERYVGGVNTVCS